MMCRIMEEWGEELRQQSFKQGYEQGYREGRKETIKSLQLFMSINEIAVKMDYPLDYVKEIATKA